VFEQLDGYFRAGRANGLRGIPTGFSPLDSYLHGGLRVGELFSWVGAQGLAEHLGVGGGVLLERLIAMESALVGEEGPIGELLAELGEAQPVLQRLAGYEERLFLVKAGAMATAADADPPSAGRHRAGR
jgi:hypothetical protein